MTFSIWGRRKWGRRWQWNGSFVQKDDAMNAFKDKCDQKWGWFDVVLLVDIRTYPYMSLTEKEMLCCGRTLDFKR